MTPLSNSISAISANYGRELWQPNHSEQLVAIETLAKSGGYSNALRQRVEDWLVHCRQCRRRAHDYRRQALGFSPGSRDYEYYRKRANEQWIRAKDALMRARLERGYL